MSKQELHRWFYVIAGLVALWRFSRDEFLDHRGKKVNANSPIRFSLLLVAGLIIVSLISCKRPAATPAPGSPETWAKFEAKLDYIRQTMKIPGMSAAVVMDQKLVWAKGFGYADLENHIEATPDTVYHLASVTKAVAATLIMQLVQEGLISLDDPVSKYGVELESQGTILVRHLLTHTSTGVPGTTYIYDGGRYGYLSQIAERATGKSFGALIQERILNPSGMTNTWLDYPHCAIALGQSPYPSDWDASGIQVTKPYQLNRSFEIIDGKYNHLGVNAAVGLISTIGDLAKFNIALDQNILLEEQTKEMMLSPAVPELTNRPDLGHGLGWYSMEYMGTHLNWHAGWDAPSVSANIVRAPEQGLTFIILANTDHLSVPYPHIDITYNTMALTFYETFVYPRKSGKSVPEVNWEADKATLVNQLGKVKDPDLRKILERELWAYRQLFYSVGRTDLVDRLLKVHQQVYPEFSPSELDLYTTYGIANDVSPTLMRDQAQLTPAEQERLVGIYVLKDQTHAAGLPVEARFQVIDGRLIVSFAGGCYDLVSITPTRFTTAEEAFFASFQMNGEEVEHVKVQGPNFAVVYIPIPNGSDRRQ